MRGYDTLKTGQLLLNMLDKSHELNTLLSTVAPDDKELERLIYNTCVSQKALQAYLIDKAEGPKKQPVQAYKSPPFVHDHWPSAEYIKKCAVQITAQSQQLPVSSS